MPELVPITNNFFVNLITRLGLKPPPGLGWVMQTVVTPVSIVDTDVTLSAAATTQLLDTAFSTGEQAVPGINTVLADTGPQNAGNYLLVIWLSMSESVNNQKLAIQRRDSANAANIWEQRIYNSAAATGIPNFTYQYQIRVTLSNSERVRVIILVAGGAGSIYHANIFLLAS